MHFLVMVIRWVALQAVVINPCQCQTLTRELYLAALIHNLEQIKDKMDEWIKSAKQLTIY